MSIHDSTEIAKIKILMLKGEKGEKGEGSYDDTEIRELVAEEASTRRTNDAALSALIATEEESREEADNAGMLKFLSADYLYTVTPDNTTAQGFATDGTYGYICYYYSTGNARYRKFSMEDGSTILDVDSGLEIHANNITIGEDDYLYITAGNGTNYVYVYDKTFTLIKTMDIGTPIHSFGRVPDLDVAAVDGYLAFALLTTQRKAITVWVDDDSLKNTVVQKRDLEYTNYAGDRNGFHVGAQSFLTMGTYITNNNVVYPNAIDIYDFFCHKVRSLVILNVESELEDISRVSGDSYTYLSDIDGKIYRIATSGYLTNRLDSGAPIFWDKGTLNAPWSATPYDVVVSNHVITSFKLPVPHSSAMLGMPYVDPSWSIDNVQSSIVKFSPSTGSLNILALIVRGNQVLLVRLSYTTSNYYEYTLSVALVLEWTSLNGWTFYSDVANTNPFTTDMAISINPIVFLPCPSGTMKGDTVEE